MGQRDKRCGSEHEATIGSVDEVGICAQICTTIIKLDLAIGTGGRGSSSGAVETDPACAVVKFNGCVCCVIAEHASGDGGLSDLSGLLRICARGQNDGIGGGAKIDA